MGTCRRHGAASERRATDLKALTGLFLATLLLLSACASLPVDYLRNESHTLQDTEGTRLGRPGESALKTHTGQNAFDL
jgi:hypothetical protein